MNTSQLIFFREIMDVYCKIMRNIYVRKHTVWETLQSSVILKQVVGIVTI